MPHALSILFGAGFTIAVSLAIGRILFRRLGVELYRQEEHPLAFITGASIWSMVVFLLASAGWVYDTVLLAIGGLVLLAAWREGVWKPRGEPLEPLPKLWRWIWIGALCVFGLLYLTNAMAPEFSPDGTTYHLGLVSRYYRAHGFEPITTNMYANLSQGIELLYLSAYAFGRHSAASVVHLGFLLAMVWSMVNYARRFGIASAGAAGALLFFLSPVVGRDGTTAYNDVATAAVIFAVFHMVAIWSEKRSPALIAPIGLAAGFCYGAKYTAFLAVPYAMAHLGWHLWRKREPWLRPMLLFTACVTVMVLPWMLKDWIVLGNPVSPFFNSVFPNPHTHIGFEEIYSMRLRHYDLPSLWQIPKEIFWNGEPLSGLLGPIFLLSPIALLSLGKKEGRRLMLAALVFGITYATNIGTRFLIPALPFVSMAMAMALIRWKPLVAGLVLVHAVISWPNVVATYCGRYAWRLEHIELDGALRLTPEAEWLSSRHTDYAVAQLIEQQVPEGEKVYTSYGVPESYTTREIIGSYKGAINQDLNDMLWTPFTADSQPTRHLRFVFPEESYKKLRVVQTASDGGIEEYWSISEMRIYDQGVEVPRDPSWRLRANPNPWYVQRAFDNSDVTRWKSWQRLFDGMFVEVDLGEPRKVDTVVVESSRDQWDTRLRLEADDGSGDWQVIDNEPDDTEVEPPLGMRRAVSREFQAAGVRYLLISDQDYGADDFKQHTAEWGITELGDVGGVRLYRID